ncbi:MAG: YlbF family regulator [Armatimonadetes bacterium]|nr:YlbF family regulator [Armatimonadota bacterium]
MQNLSNSALWKEAETFLARLPLAPRSAPPCRDPRLRRPLLDEKQKAALTPNPKLAERIQFLSEKLMPTGNPSLAEIKLLLNNPEYKELIALTEQLQNNPELKRYEAQQQTFNQEQARYDAETKAWLKSSGYAMVPAWRGRAVALYLGTRSQTSTVSFTTTKRYFDTSSGRQVWSGPCSLVAGIDGEGERRYERTNPANLQFFLGQEGFLLKYSGASFGEKRLLIYQPFISTHLFSLSKTEHFPHILGSPGDAGLVGFPFSGGNSKKLIGKLVLSLPDQATYTTGWELEPATQ